MDFYTSHNSRVEKYFIAWEKYDINLLKKIFSPNAHYIIKGKKIYRGINEIKAYWLRNEKRQKNLHLNWNIIKSEELMDIVNFNATFWDSEDNINNIINGRITFKFNNENTIILLSEIYSKEEFV